MNSPLSQCQLGIYYACRTTVDEKINYQCPGLFTLPASADLEKLRLALIDALNAHPYLMSRIVEDENGIPAATDGLPAKVEITDLSQSEWEQVQTSFASTMDIHSDRLYRAEIYRVGEQSYLYLDFHHVVLDGFSMALMLKEIERVYSGRKPAGEMLDGAAVAKIEESLREDTSAMEEARKWYASEFAEAADTESLPIPESGLAGTEKEPLIIYKHYPLKISAEQMKALVNRFGCSELIITEAAWALLSCSYTASENASFCTVFWGRTDRKTLNTTTMMVHTLPVMVKVGGDMPLTEILSRLDTQTSLTRKYQYYAYQDAVQDLGLNNQVMFIYQGAVMADKRGLHLDGVFVPHTDLRRPAPGWRLSSEFFEHDGTYSLKLGYSSTDYSDGYMQELANSFSAVLKSMLTADFVRDIEYCDVEQLSWLEARNPSRMVVLPKSDGLVERFRKRVAEHPDAVCVVAGDKSLTYAQVDALTQTIDPAYTVECGDRVVGYTVPRNEQMVLVPLSIAKAGKILLPLDGSYPPERLEYMKKDAAQCDAPEAFVLLYTSGTTGEPKGVMLSQRNVLAFCDYHCRYFGIDARSRSASYAGYGFDAFQQDLWSTLISGATMYILPDEVRFDLEAMRVFFDENGITHSFMTTQVATQMAINYPEMRTLKVLGTGGEKLMSIDPPKTYHLYNGYGPTESIAYVCSYIVEKKEENIPIGFVNDTTRLHIVNKCGKPVPWGAAGEMLVAGEQVSLGYLNKPEKTAEAFVEWNGERVYRTGDVVRYRADGAIEFVGRKDGQVKIRGFRIELKEVEGVIREYPGIKDATVQAFEQEGGGKFIAAYVVSDSKVVIEDLNAFILDRKPPYMVPAVTMQIDAIPLNQNQKVNKRALPEPKIQLNESSSGGCAAPLNLLEQELHDMVAGIVNNADFGITTDLRMVGLTSISAIKLATQVFKRYGVQLDAKQITKGITIQAIENELLAVLLKNPAQTGGDSSGAGNAAGEKADRKGLPTPLSYAQTGVYFDCMKNPTSTLYNIPMRLQLPADISNDALRKAVEEAVANHPELHVRFRTNETGVMQIEEDIDFKVEELQMDEEQAEDYKTEFVRPFNLANDMLCRMAIVRTENNLYLYCDIHHLVCDGASYDIFINEICALLDGKAIEPEICTYAEFVSEQKAAEEGESFAASAEFFKSRLEDADGATELTSDLTNPKQQGEIAYVSAPFDAEAAGELARTLGVTPAALSLSAVFYTLSRFAATDQVCITTISNGRSNLRISNTMGMFVNTLALTAKIGEQTVAEFIRECAGSFEETLAHEDYPFARIAADYNLTAEILFAYQMGIFSRYEVHGKEVLSDNMELNVPKFKISFYIMEVEGKPAVAIEYDDGRYSQGMMQSLARSVSNALSAFASQPDAPLRSVCLADESQISLLDSFNQTDVPYDETQTIVSLFRRQVQLTPDNMAVVYHQNRYTYSQADDLSERIATLLVSKGLGKEDVVSIIIPRCEWMPIAALGVLKAGCAYQPLDPSYPAERLNFMIKDASAKMLIADESLRGILNEYNGDVLLTKDIFDLPRAERSVDVTVNPSDLFILLYTSGSTGTPKGCQLEHRNLAAFCNWYRRRFELKAEHHVSCYASYGFDCCMMDLYPALTCGACVYIIGDDIRLNLPEVNAYFEANHITHSFMTTQVAYQFATNMDNHSLQHLIAAGEKLASMAPPANFKMHNGYGPTEGTILITEYELDKELKDIPVGRPLDNSRLYIVDSQFNRLPQGAAGELWISGAHVTRSYLNRPDKTAEVYIRNPFTDDPKYSRVYRTGDIVRYLGDGNIQFVGRRDGQVKIRGFRIELKEVESVIRAFPGIKDATVQAFDYPNGGKFIAAYIVSDSKVDIQELNDFIKESKPSYMVPAATMQLDAIPLNQNQKVNKRALPAPQITSGNREYVEPAGETEKLFCDIFASVLSMDKVGATDSFFELGGTSLMVTRVIIEADKAGKSFAYADLFSHPTPRMLASLTDGRTEGEDTPDTTVVNYDYAPMQELLARNNLKFFASGKPRELGNVLLTGSTGYLGIHVLNELFSSDAKTITCLVRGKTQADALRRLQTLYYYYFAHRIDDMVGSRLFVVNSDVTSDFSELVSGSIDTLINCAANVKHFSKGTDIEDVNIGGAQNCVNYCLAAGATLIHVSTTSIGGLWMGSGAPAPVLTEQKIFFGQDLSNQYTHSKFLAERLILEAVINKGLKAKIMRVGNLAARSYDGEFQVNFSSNSYMGRIKIFNMLGCCPFEYFNKPAEFSPVDETARAIVLLSHTPECCTLFHPYNTHTRLLGDVLSGLENIGTSVKFVEIQEFTAAVQKAAMDSSKASLLTTMVAYQGNPQAKAAQIVDCNNEYTAQVLLRMGFKWTEPDTPYINRMLSAISQLGFFDA